MKRFKRLLTMSLAAELIACLSVGIAQAECKFVNGHISSEVVSTFSNGDLCSSPIGLCTEGRFIGGLKGDFRFIAQTLVLTSTPGVAFTTGDIILTTDDGTLVFEDTSAFSLEPDGQFGGLETVVEGASTGDYAGATGRIRPSGVFMEGCVACDYRGEICTP